MPWHPFGRVSRRRLEEAERHARSLEHLVEYKDGLLDDYLTQWRRVLDHNVRLRRELDALRNHVPLFGDVFNGKVL